MDPSPNLPTGHGEAPPAGGPEPRPEISAAAGAVPDPGAKAGASAPAGGPVQATRRPGALRLDRRTAVLAAAAVAVVLGGMWAGTGYRYEPYVDAPATVTGKVPTGDRELKQLTTRLERRSRELAVRLKGTAPRGVYIVIDQTQNRLYLRRDDETLLDAKCSAGSGMVLRESVGKKREWVFDTPRGRFEVIALMRNPVWKKPDWAFVEEGQPIPKNPADRLESGTLGEFALYFGNGFMIHGTLYERLLGRAVSHGCIRVGREDLRKVWANARLGTPIFIY
jgi:L,D-transpeptidase YbiS